MRTVRAYLCLVLISMVAVGCDDQGTEVEGITVEDLVGSWTATSKVYTNNANASETFDFLANGGETRMTVLTGGRARTWVDIGTFSDEWDAQLTMNGNTLTSQPAEASRPVKEYTFTLDGDVLTLVDAASAYDFPPGDGTAVSATETTVMERQ